MPAQMRYGQELEGASLFAASHPNPVPEGTSRTGLMPRPIPCAMATLLSSVNSPLPSSTSCAARWGTVQIGGIGTEAI